MHLLHPPPYPKSNTFRYVEHYSHGGGSLTAGRANHAGQALSCRKKIGGWAWYEYSQLEKGKAISVQAWTGPEGFRRMTLSDFEIIGIYRLVRLSAPGTGRLYTPENISWYSFLLEAESTPGTWCARKDYGMTSSGIEPAIFRLVVQCLDQLCHRVKIQLSWITDKEEATARKRAKTPYKKHNNKRNICEQLLETPSLDCCFKPLD